MRLARTLFLLAATAIASLALAATANADGLEVVDEDTGAHCPEVETNGTHTPSGGCFLSAETEDTSTADLAFHISTGETVFSQCTNTFDARVHETGDGFIYNAELGGAQCGRTPCDEAETGEAPHAEIPWPFTISEFNPGMESLNVTFCVRGVGTPENPTPEGGDETNPNSPCTVSVPINDDDGPHQYEFRIGAPNNRCAQNPIISLTGHWDLTSTPIEVIH